MMWWWRVLDAIDDLRPGVGRAMPWSVPHTSTLPALAAVVAVVILMALAGVASGLVPMAAGIGASAAPPVGEALAPPAAEPNPGLPPEVSPADADPAVSPATDPALGPETQPPVPPVAAPALPPAGTYVWLQEVGGQPATWECAPIPWRLVVEDAPLSAQGFVAEAMARVSEASGGAITFAPVPAVSTWQEVQADWPGISIGWTDQGWREGVAGTAESTTRGDGIAQALVRLRLGESYSEALNFGPDGLGPILVHEIAHAVGLGHVDQSVDSIMTPVNTGQTEFSDTDQKALAYLGWQACATP